jgi:hypothetical protein
MNIPMHPLAEMTLFAMWAPAMIAGSWLIAKLLNGGFKATCVLGAAFMLFLAGYLGVNPTNEKQASEDLLFALCLTALVLVALAVSKMIVENVSENARRKNHLALTNQAISSGLAANRVMNPNNQHRRP